jgi:cell division protease FtsH
MQDNNQKEPQEKKSRRRFDIVFILVVVILIVCIFFLIRGFTKSNPDTLDYQTFVNALDSGKVTGTINATPVGGDNYLMYNLTGTYINGNGDTVGFTINVTNDILSSFITKYAGYKFYLVPVQDNMWLSILISFLPYIIMAIIFFFLFRSLMKSQGGAGGAFDFAKSTAKLSRGKSVTFKDVAGCD